jgi:hypothetical protein
MNSNDEARSIVWSACDCDDPEKLATSTRVEDGDSQAEAEQHARQIGYPFVVGYTLITHPNGDWEFDEDAEPVFARVRGDYGTTAADVIQ